MVSPAEDVTELLRAWGKGDGGARERLTPLVYDELRKLAAAPADQGPRAMIRLMAWVLGIGVETADMLVNEALSRHLRDDEAIARYAGLTGSQDESGKRRRERGLARAGNARVRCGHDPVGLGVFSNSKRSALTQWFHARTADGRAGMRKTMIVALARKLLIALWRLATTAEV